MKFLITSPQNLGEELNIEILELHQKFCQMTKLNPRENDKNTSHSLKIHSVLTSALIAESDESFLIFVLLYSRIAAHIYRYLDEQVVHTQKDLYQFSKDKIAWEKEFNLEQTFAFKVTTSLSQTVAGEQWKNTILLAQVLKDGLVDRMRLHFDNQRPSVDLKRPDISFYCHLSAEKNSSIVTAALYVDLSVRPLSQRGYLSRTDGFHAAPLKENLAAAILRMMNYPAVKKPLIDLMAGSGTIIAEATLMALDLPAQFWHLDLMQRSWKKKEANDSSPGRKAFSNPDLEILDYMLTTFSFTKHRWWAELVDRENETQKRLMKISYALQALADELNESLRQRWENFSPNLTGEIPLLFANDKDTRLIETLERQYRVLWNLGAPVEGKKERSVFFKSEKIVRQLTIPSSIRDHSPLIFANLPYGIRLEDENAAIQLAHQTGEYLKHWAKGSTAYLLLGSQEQRKSIGLRTSARLSVFNGPIECRLCRYELF